jgi:hypothetical protein
MCTHRSDVNKIIFNLSKRLQDKGILTDPNEWQQKLYYSVSQEAKGEISLSSTAVLAAAVQAVLAELMDANARLQQPKDSRAVMVRTRPPQAAEYGERGQPR